MQQRALRARAPSHCGHGLKIASKHFRIERRGHAHHAEIGPRPRQKQLAQFDQQEVFGKATLVHFVHDHVRNVGEVRIGDEALEEDA